MNTRYPDRYFTPTIPSLYSFTAHVYALTRQPPFRRLHVKTFINTSGTIALVYTSQRRG